MYNTRANSKLNQQTNWNSNWLSEYHTQNEAAKLRCKLERHKLRWKIAESENTELESKLKEYTNTIDNLQYDNDKLTDELTSMKARLTDNKVQKQDMDYEPGDDLMYSLSARVAYQHIYSNMLCALENMTFNQLINATTKMDISMIGYERKRDKMFYSYAVLITIARKAVQEGNNDVCFLLESRHKLTEDVRFIILENINNIKPEWEVFLKLSFRIRLEK